MKQWWHTLSGRERGLLITAASGLIALLVYFGAWKPLQAELADTRQTVNRLHADLAWMVQAIARSERQLFPTSTAGTAQTTAATGSLAVQIEQTAHQAGISASLTRVEPQGQQQIRIWLKEVQFDTLLIWLGTLRYGHGIQVIQSTIEPASGAAMVDARFTLGGIPDDAG